MFTDTHNPGRQRAYCNVEGCCRLVECWWMFKNQLRGVLEKAYFSGLLPPTRALSKLVMLDQPVPNIPKMLTTCSHTPVWAASRIFIDRGYDVLADGRGCCDLYRASWCWWRHHLKTSLFLLKKRNYLKDTESISGGGGLRERNKQTPQSVQSLT